MNATCCRQVFSMLNLFSFFLVDLSTGKFFIHKKLIVTDFIASMMCRLCMLGTLLFLYKIHVNEPFVPGFNFTTMDTGEFIFNS